MQTRTHMDINNLISAHVVEELPETRKCYCTTDSGDNELIPRVRGNDNFKYPYRQHQNFGGADEWEVRGHSLITCGEVLPRKIFETCDLEMTVKH
ncbi:hypothetical protein J6590_102769 [Homalodisca vitripennis]|nr:hypothetical protein J6590_102769 [Homalodisca vitripennis]